MSFEGYHQLLCKNGHEWSRDVYEDYSFDGTDYSDNMKNTICPQCKEKVVWWNLVDLTNGSYDEYFLAIDSKGHKHRVDYNDLYKLDFDIEKAKKKLLVIGGNKIKKWEPIIRRIDGYVKLKIDKKITGKCDKCNKEHVCEITYKIPKKKKK